MSLRTALTGATALALSCLPWATARADDATDFQLWNEVVAQVDLGRLTEGLRLDMEMTVRRGSPADVDAQTGELTPEPRTYLFVRPSLSYAVTPWFRAALGYAYTPVYYDRDDIPRPTNIHENRVWEQATFKYDAERFGLASRTRLEQRMRTQGSGTGQVAVRLRQRLRFHYTLLDGEPWQLIASYALFFYLNSTGIEEDPGFSEQRAFAGIGYELDTVRVEVGYLDQWAPSPGEIGRHNYVLSSAVTFVFKP